MLHTGAYCPSKTVDMICGNVSRGKRVRKEAKVGYTNFFDDNDLLIRADSKDESYEKNYLLGKYGAIPSLKTIDFFKEG